MSISTFIWLLSHISRSKYKLVWFCLIDIHDYYYIFFLDILTGGHRSWDDFGVFSNIGDASNWYSPVGNGTPEMRAKMNINLLIWDSHHYMHDKQLKAEILGRRRYRMKFFIDTFNINWKSMTPNWQKY